MTTAFFLLLLSVIFCSCKSSCPSGPGWQQSALDPNKCYLVVTAPKRSWREAELFCKNSAPNGHLTSINSAFESLELNAIVNRNANFSQCDQLWIGGIDSNAVGNFNWSDGRPFQYSNWQMGEPDLFYRCVTLSPGKSGRWETNDCNTNYCFICENYAAPSTTPSSGTTAPTLPRDCYDANQQQTEDGVYAIKLPNNNIVNVFCDFSGGGWTVIQSREADGINFNRTYAQYRSNFGNPGMSSSFWLGLDNIHSLTAGDALRSAYSLKIELCCNSVARSETYHYFFIANGVGKYQLNVSQGAGSAQDGFNSVVFDIKDNGAQFSTFDNWNAQIPPGICGSFAGYGGWWFGSCGNNLNGFEYNNPADYSDPSHCLLADRPNGAGITWNGVTATSTKARMKVIPRDQLPLLNDNALEQERLLAFCSS